MLLGEQNDGPSSRLQILLLVVMMLFLFGLPYIMSALRPEPPETPPPAAERVILQEENTPALAAKPDLPAETEEVTPPPDREEPVEAEAHTGLVSAPSQARDDNVILENDRLRLEFTRVGGRLKHAWVLVGKNEEEHPQLVLLDEDTPDVDAFLPLDVFGVSPDGMWAGNELGRALWEVEPGSPANQVTFSYTAEGIARVVKTFTLNPDDYLLDLSVAYTNLSGKEQILGVDTHVPAYSVTWEPNLHSGESGRMAGQESVVWRSGGVTTSVATSKLKPPASAAGYSEYVEHPTWIAVRSTYFLVAMRSLPGTVPGPEVEGETQSEAKTDWTERSWGWVAGNPQLFRIGLAVPREEAGPGETLESGFRFYIGPTQLASLKEATGHGFPELDEALQFFTSVGFMDTFAKLLLSMLHFFHEHVWANWGVAIILLTIVVRMAVFPLTLKGMKSMRRMQLLAPEIEKIKEETKDDPQELQKRTMELYKHYGINPLGGCMPLLLQMPVFFALYRMLWTSFELRGAEFLWIEDLSKQDALIHFGREIPLVFFSIDAFNVLPILMAVTMLVSQRMTPTSVAMQPQQKMIMNVMPVMFSLFLYNYSSGLNLYILTSTLLGIGQNMLVRAQHVELTPKELKPKATAKRRPQHFYNAAQAKKKEMAKEARKAKEKQRARGTGGSTGPKKRS